MKAIVFNLKAVFELPDNINTIDDNGNIVDDNGNIDIELKKHPGKDLFINPQYLLDSADINLSQKDEKSLDDNYLAGSWKYELVELSDEGETIGGVTVNAHRQIDTLIEHN